MLELYKHNLNRKVFLIYLFIASPLLWPQQSKLSKEVNAISEYIASDHFTFLNQTNDPLANIDSIYVNAISICNNDTQETLLALTFAMVPYRKVPIKLPTSKIIINYPLVSADLETFEKKTKNVPRELYFDTPDIPSGDNDKPAHFFGSAFISYSSNIFDLGNLIGYFVEVFEETFKVQSQIDQRDLQTNQLGNLFGKLLKKDKNLMPSKLFMMKTFMQIRMNL